MQERTLSPPSLRFCSILSIRSWKSWMMTKVWTVLSERVTMKAFQGCASYTWTKPPKPFFSFPYFIAYHDITSTPSESENDKERGGTSFISYAP